MVLVQHSPGDLRYYSPAALTPRGEAELAATAANRLRRREVLISSPNLKYPSTEFFGASRMEILEGIRRLLGSQDSGVVSKASAPLYHADLLDRQQTPKIAPGSADAPADCLAFLTLRPSTFQRSWGHPVGASGYLRAGKARAEADSAELSLGIEGLGAAAANEDGRDAPGEWEERGVGQDQSDPRGQGSTDSGALENFSRRGPSQVSETPETSGTQEDGLLSPSARRHVASPGRSEPAGPVWELPTQAQAFPSTLGAAGSSRGAEVVRDADAPGGAGIAVSHSFPPSASELLQLPPSRFCCDSSPLEACPGQAAQTVEVESPALLGTERSSARATRATHSVRSGRDPHSPHSATSPTRMPMESPASPEPPEPLESLESPVSPVSPVSTASPAPSVSSVSPETSPLPSPPSLPLPARLNVFRPFSPPTLDLAPAPTPGGFFMDCLRASPTVQHDSEFPISSLIPRKLDRLERKQFYMGVVSRSSTYMNLEHLLRLSRAGELEALAVHRPVPQFEVLNLGGIRYCLLKQEHYPSFLRSKHAVPDDTSGDAAPDVPWSDFTEALQRVRDSKGRSAAYWSASETERRFSWMAYARCRKFSALSIFSALCEQTASSASKSRHSYYRRLVCPICGRIFDLDELLKSFLPKNAKASYGRQMIFREVGRDRPRLCDELAKLEGELSSLCREAGEPGGVLSSHAVPGAGLGAVPATQDTQDAGQGTEQSVEQSIEKGAEQSVDENKTQACPSLTPHDDFGDTDRPADTKLRHVVSEVLRISDLASLGNVDELVARIHQQKPPAISPTKYDSSEDSGGGLKGASTAEPAQPESSAQAQANGPPGPSTAFPGNPFIRNLGVDYRAELARLARPVISNVMENAFIDHIQREKFRLCGAFMLDERKELEQRPILTELRLRAAQRIVNSARPYGAAL